MSHQFYSDDDAEAILKLASRRAGGGSVSHDRLLETAAELGISPEAVKEAELSYRQERQDALDSAAYQKHKRSEFYGHLATYVLTCGGLAALDFVLSGHHFTWVYWVALFWGIGVFQACREAFFPGVMEREKGLRRWQRRQERRALIAEKSRDRSYDINIVKSDGSPLRVNIGGSQDGR